MDRKIIVFAVLFITLTLGAILTFNYFNKENDSTDDGDQTTYSKIVISSTTVDDEKKVYGELYVKDNKLVHEIENSSNLDDYIEEMRSTWENEELEYDDGGYDDNGNHIDSVKYTRIGDNDFLKAIYTDLYDYWDGFHFDLQ